MNEIDLKDFLKKRQLNFQDRLVPDFINMLGYRDEWITKEPKCGSGKADYLVEDPAGKFFIEAHSPDLSRGSLLDVETRVRTERFENELSRRAQRTLPTIFEQCFLMLEYGSIGSTLTRDVTGPEVISILNKLSQWAERIDEIPEYTNDRVRSYRLYELCPELDPREFEVKIPYPYGSLVISSSRGDYTIRWKLLRRHRKYGPKKPHMFLTGGPGGDATPYNAARGVKRKIEQHRKRVKCDPEAQDIPLILFLDGRSDLHFGKAGDHFDLDRLFAEEIRWGSQIPHAIVLVGTWGVPTGATLSGEVEGRMGDMIFNPRDPRIGKPYLQCFTRFLRPKCDVVRLWTTRRHIVPIE